MDWLQALLSGQHMQFPGADAMGAGLGTPYNGTPLPPPDMGYGPQAPDMSMGPPTPPSLGQSLEPTPPPDMGYGPQQPAQGTGGQAAASAVKAPGNAILDSLRGVTAPARPDVVKPSTPALPQQKAIQAGQLFQLLSELNNPRLPNRQPTTLGQSLGIGRY